MDSDRLLWILLTSTNGILVVFLIIPIQQLCITDFYDKTRTRRTLLIIFNSICFPFLNALMYLSTLYPNYMLMTWFSMYAMLAMFEALVNIIAYHTISLLVSAMIGRIYNSVNLNAPKRFLYFLNTLEFIYVVSMLFCHSCAVIFNDPKYLWYAHICLGSVISINSIIVIFLFQRVLHIFNTIGQTNIRASSSGAVAQAKFYTRIVVVVAVIFVVLGTMICIADPQISLTNKLFTFSANTFSYFCILHSLLLILIDFTLILSIYQRNYCCKIPENSVCDMFIMVYCNCGCDDEIFENMFESQEALKHKRMPVLLQESVASTNVEETTSVIGNVRITNHKNRIVPIGEQTWIISDTSITNHAIQPKIGEASYVTKSHQNEHTVTSSIKGNVYVTKQNEKTVFL
eukprot:192569_1